MDPFIETFPDWHRWPAQEIGTSSGPIGGPVHGSGLESLEQLESGRSAAW